MDTLFWNKHSPKIKFKDTKKQYFNKYTWRLELLVGGADMTNPKSCYNIDKEVATRIARMRASKRNYSTWFDEAKLDRLLASGAETLNYIKDIRIDPEAKVRIRSEGDHMQIYAQCEDDLKDVIKALKGVEFVSITSPAPGTELQLTKNCIITHNKDEYKFKIIFRDGSYNQEAKTTLAELLKSQGKDVRIPDHTKKMLGTRYSGLWNCYMYTNEESIASMLVMTCPGIVGKIHEMVYVAKY